MAQSSFIIKNKTMYAVIKNNIVLDYAFLEKNIMKSPISQKEYSDKDDYFFIEMTLENSPAEEGMFYDAANNNFYFKGVEK